jgi:hypothetical protein
VKPYSIPVVRNPSRASDSTGYHVNQCRPESKRLHNAVFPLFDVIPIRPIVIDETG